MLVAARNRTTLVLVLVLVHRPMAENAARAADALCILVQVMRYTPDRPYLLIKAAGLGAFLFGPTAVHADAALHGVDHPAVAVDFHSVS